MTPAAEVEQMALAGNAGDSRASITEAPPASSTPETAADEGTGPEPASLHTPASDQMDPSEKSSEPERRSLEDFAKWIGFNYAAWAKLSAKNGFSYEIIPTEWRRMWHKYLHLAVIADGKRPDGALWFDGVEWQVDPEGRAIQVAMYAAIHRAEEEIRVESGPEYKINLPRQLMDLKPIAALRKSNRVYDPEKQVSDGKLVFADGVCVRILPDGKIKRTDVDPDKDIWFGTLPIPSAALVERIEEYGDWEELAREKFPNWYDAISACGPDKPAFIATIAGAVVYSSCKDVPALDVLFWAFDAELGHTGKTRHLTLVRDAFGGLAGAGDWSDIIGKHSHTGDLQGKYLLFCDEAGDGMIKDTAFLKALVSGTATYRPLYRDPQTLTHPVIIMCAANHRPVISPAAAKTPVLRRFVCSEWTEQFPESSAFPCKKEEALAAIVNVGYAVARKCILTVSGGKSAKEALPFRNDIAELEELVQFVPWMEELAMIIHEGGEVGVTELRLALVKSLMEKGMIPDIPQNILETGKIPAEYLRSCPELRTNNAFRGVIHGRELYERFTEQYGVHRENKFRVYVKDRNNATNNGDGERFVVDGCRLRDKA